MSFARSFTACLAELLALDPTAFPHAEAEDLVVARAREWLATRGLGLVPVLSPAGFGWPAPWIARLQDGRAVLAFGSPPGVIHDPFGPGDGAAAVLTEGWVLAPAGPPVPLATPSGSGRVEALLVSSTAGAPMRRVEQTDALAGRGLRGDRYADGAGTFSDPGGTGHDVTLVESEALEALGVSAEAARRNVVTRGIDLDGLIGRRFRIGDVECFGQRRCEPCAHLERLGPPGILRTLVHRGGLRADVVTGGTLRPASAIAVLDR